MKLQGYSGSHTRCRHYKQRGAITLLVTMLIMIAMTIGSFAMIHTSSMESRMTLNDLHSRQSMQAAQAGIDFVLGHMGQDPIDRDTLCSSSIWLSNGFLLNFSGPDPITGILSFDNPAALALDCSNQPFELLSQTSIWSRGYSNNDESIRTLMSTLDLERRWNFSYQAPQPVSSTALAPITTRRNFTTTGNAADVAYCRTIAECNSMRGGGQTDEGLRDGQLLITSGGTADNSKNIELGIRDQNNTVIRDMSTEDFFTTYIGNNEITKEEFRTSDDTTRLTSGQVSSSTIAAGKQQIWVTGDVVLAGNTTIGTADRPVIMVINGNLDIRGNAAIWGLVYTTGNVSMGRGTPRVMGSVVSEQDFNLTGSAAVYSNADLLPVSQIDGSSMTALPPTLGSETSSSVRIGSWRELVR